MNRSTTGRFHSGQHACLNCLIITENAENIKAFHNILRNQQGEKMPSNSENDILVFIKWRKILQNLIRFLSLTLYVSISPKFNVSRPRRQKLFLQFLSKAETTESQWVIYPKSEKIISSVYARPILYNITHIYQDVRYQYKAYINSIPILQINSNITMQITI